MDKKSKILLWTMLILVLASAGVTYYRYMILRAFEVIQPSEEVTNSNEQVSTDQSATTSVDVGGSETI